MYMHVSICIHVRRFSQHHCRTGILNINTQQHNVFKVSYFTRVATALLDNCPVFPPKQLSELSLAPGQHIIRSCSQ